MKTLFLLMVLTQNGAGDINASFVNTETLEQCQQKAQMVEGVFLASNIPVVESHCIQSELRFSEFNHASTSSMIRNFYLIKVNGAEVQLAKMQDWAACMAQAKQASESVRVYCSSSVQSLAEE
ncbi:MAG: hypothetical protein OEY66_12715 [Gammaproteobacteria bacterium]|nr:hypothetical protein [Gammaproteobacteria bacterium]